MTNFARHRLVIIWIFSALYCLPVAGQSPPLGHLTHLTHLKGSIQSTKKSDYANFNESVNIYKTGDYNAARLCFWRLSQETPNDYRVHYYLANSFLQMKDFANAQIWYDKCLASGPDADTAQNCTRAISYLKSLNAAGAEKKNSDVAVATTKTASATPLSYPGRDTAGEAVHRRVKQPPAGLIKLLDDSQTTSSSVYLSVKYGLETIPDSVLARLMSNGYSILIAPTILDAIPRRAGESPRGYGDDSNYDNAAALFRTEVRQVVIAEKLQLRKNSPDYKPNDFAVAAVRHELGHAVDCDAGYPSRGNEFKLAYDKDEKKLSSFDRNRFAYFLQPGDAGKAELFAELFSAKYCPDNWKTKKMVDLVNAFADVTPLMKDY